MTLTLVPFRETKRQNPHRLHEGPYYGRQLRRVLAPPPPSIIDRLTSWYESVPARVLWAWCVIVIACVAAGVACAL